MFCHKKIVVVLITGRIHVYWDCSDEQWDNNPLKMDLKNTCPGRITEPNFSWMPWILVYLRSGFCAIFNSIHYPTLELQSKNIVVLVVLSVTNRNCCCLFDFAFTDLLFRFFLQIRFYVHDLISCNSIPNTFLSFNMCSSWN